MDWFCFCDFNFELKKQIMPFFIHCILCSKSVDMRVFVWCTLTYTHAQRERDRSVAFFIQRALPSAVAFFWHGFGRKKSHWHRLQASVSQCLKIMSCLLHSVHPLWAHSFRNFLLWIDPKNMTEFVNRLSDFTKIGCYLVSSTRVMVDKKVCLVSPGLFFIWHWQYLLGIQN